MHVIKERECLEEHNFLLSSELPCKNKRKADGFDYFVQRLLNVKCSRAPLCFESLLFMYSDFQSSNTLQPTAEVPTMYYIPLLQLFA